MKCTKCERIWTGLSQCHCAGCCRHFATVKGFDAHQPAKDNFKCQDPPSRFIQDDAGVWRRAEKRPQYYSETLSDERGMVA